MKLYRPFLSVLALAAFLVSACAPAAPPSPTAAPAKPAAPTAAPQPTAAPAKAAEPAKPAAAPAKAPEPTKPVAQPTSAPVAQPTAVPAKKVDFPTKGKAITFIVPYAAGGAADTGSRAVAAALEKALGTPVQVVNKAGANGQVGWTELSLSKADGYSLAYMSVPTAIPTYLDPEHKANYNRQSFQVVAGYAIDPIVLAVKAGDNRFRSVKDLMESAKANPEKVKVGTAGGALSIADLAVLQMQKVAGVKLAAVQFDGGGPAVTALLGGHIDALVGSGGTLATQVKGGQLVALGVMDKTESPFFPGVKTMEAQGQNINLTSYMGVVVSTGTPKEIIGILSAATEKAVKSDQELKTRMDSMGIALRYISAEDYSKQWQDLEAQVQPLMALRR